jgi:DNA-binding CsgD family transcriptional regulator
MATTGSSERREVERRSAWPVILLRGLPAASGVQRGFAADSRAGCARNGFDALGVVSWSERARQELRASGETSLARTPEARDQPTPQVLQIARMAAEGLTNREIGQKLYLSHRTVGAHLRHVFRKLGVASRRQLTAALACGGAPSI